MRLVQIVVRVLLFVFIIFVGGLVTCGGNLVLSAGVISNTDSLMTFWIIELIGIALFALWFVFLRKRNSQELARMQDGSIGIAILLVLMILGNMVFEFGSNILTGGVIILLALGFVFWKNKLEKKDMEKTNENVPPVYTPLSKEDSVLPE